MSNHVDNALIRHGEPCFIQHGVSPADQMKSEHAALRDVWSAMKIADTGAHYRYSYRARITDEDIARGYVEVKLDPYRIASIYALGGGPREHIVKKGLRGTSKGDTERDLIRQMRDALDRWEEMVTEDGQ